MCGCRSGVRVEGTISLSDCGYFLSTGGIDIGGTESMSKRYIKLPKLNGQKVRNAD
jgi:hypothetical protein